MCPLNTGLGVRVPLAVFYIFALYVSKTIVMASTLDDPNETVLIAPSNLVYHRIAETLEDGNVAVKKSTRNIRILFVTLVAILIGFAVFFALSVVQVKQTYGIVIDTIDAAIASGKYDGPSGLRTAMAFHWGRFGAVIMGFDSITLPTALVLMHFERKWESIFNANGQTYADWYQCIRLISLLQPGLEPEGIFCIAFSCADGPVKYACPSTGICPNVASCLPSCDPTALVQYNTGGAIAIAAAQGGVSTAVSGAMIGQSIVPGIGALVGGLVGLLGGGLMAAYTSALQSQAQTKMCEANRLNCVNLPTATTCGGCRISGIRIKCSDAHI